MTAPEQPIRRSERTGVLQPQNLERYQAGRITPAASVADVVDSYWHVRWRMDPGETITQRIIDMPIPTLTVEEGAVPARLVVTGVQESAWMRKIEGWGSVFGIRLRPAGLAVVSDLTPQDIADRTVPVTPKLDRGLHALLESVAAGRSPRDRAQVADAAITERLTHREVGPEGRLANAAFDELADTIRSRVGRDLAARLGTSERNTQRALQTTVGKGPKWISRRIRLQEVARVLAVEPDLELAQLAVELGYSDQAHLTNDFRRTAGISPGAYQQTLADLTAADA